MAEVVIPLVAVLLVFGAGIVVAIRYLLFQNVVKATSHIERLSEDYSRKEEDIARKMSEASQQAEQIVTKARDEADNLREKSAKETQQEREKIIKDARSQSEQIVHQAGKTRDFLLAEINQKIREESVKIASDMVADIMPEDMRRECHARQLKELIGGELSRLEGISVPESLGDVRVISAYELTGGERSILRSEIEKRIDREIMINDEVDPGLVAGFVIEVGEARLDGSFRSRIEEIAKDVQRRTV